MMYLSLLWAWLLTDVVATYGVWHYRRGLTLLAPAQETPKVAILTAIKGVSETTPKFLDGLCQQRYPGYRLVFSLETRSDPVMRLIEGTIESLADRIAVDLVIAGTATQRAQKVHNLLAALGALRDDDEIVVFVDADILPDENWLSQLIRPVANREVAASTGYRWQLPTDGRWPSLIVAAVDMSIATAARSARWNLCWGGSIALDRAALTQLDLATAWDRAASDDLTLTAALRARGFKINAPLHVLVPSPVAHDWTSLFRFAHRQYLLVRTYAPKHWLLAGWSICLPAIGATLAATEMLAGHRWASGFILGSIGFLQMRLGIRRQIAELLLPHAAIASAKSTIRFARWAWPLIHLVHLGAYLTSVTGQRFTWAGIDYRLHGKAVSVERSMPCK
ncbi:MAG TPA: glycosyltransferase family 2 protein [Steroidobacteraceae bacterium]|jgi:ceramide glucosyltransferase|nr:glycosyltransferase family 2 protein [Steroidobacteraceae bacterium]